jgi:signal transduction histidine kinase
VVIVLCAVEAMLEIVLRQNSAKAPTSPEWFALLATAATILPLLFRRRYPFGAPAAVWAVSAVVSFYDGRLDVFTTGAFVSGLAAAFLLGNLRDERRSRLGLAVVLACSAIIVYENPSHTAIELAFLPLVFTLGWIGGFAVRERGEQAEAAELRAAQAERERDTATRLAVAEERARIARELHDIVAHAVSVMVLQVGAVRHKLPEAQGEEREALQDVEQAGRTALSEMRRLLGAMRREGEDVDLAPQPGLEDLGALFADVERAGLPVRLHVDGEPRPLPRGLDLSAYRIVQEGLTNALKHAGARQADVTLRYAPSELAIEVRDDGAGGGAATNGGGFGLVGVRERVKLYGGEMSAGPADGGGFVLATRLPLGGGS